MARSTFQDQIEPLRWWDVFGFTEQAGIQCPDCDTKSPEFEEIFSALQWIAKHLDECPA